METNAPLKTNELLVKLSDSLIRGVTYPVVNNQVNAIIKSARGIIEQDSVIEDLIVLAFQTRDIRDGKGERLASEYLFKSLLVNEYSKSRMMTSLELIPLYGCWRDLFSLGIDYCGTRLVDIVEAQFLKDEDALVTGNPISLLAKWMPREGQAGVFPFVARLTPGNMFLATRMKLYRKRVARLNKAINTVEIKMCEGNWDIIDPSNVPAIAMQKYCRAFLNLKISLHGVKPDSGLRHPNIHVRNVCRDNFQEYFNKSARGKAVSTSERYSLVRSLVKYHIRATAYD